MAESDPEPVLPKPLNPTDVGKALLDVLYRHYADRPYKRARIEEHITDEMVGRMLKQETEGDEPGRLYTQEEVNDISARVLKRIDIYVGEPEDG